MPIDRAQLVVGGGDPVAWAGQISDFFDAYEGIDLRKAAWQDYSLTVDASTTPPTLGSGGFTTASYLHLGGIVLYKFAVRFGTSGANVGSGQYRIPLPVAPDVQESDAGMSSDAFGGGTAWRG